MLSTPSEGRHLFVLSGPSCSGKNTVFDRVAQRIPVIRRAITATTRPPREDETEGVDYFFMSEAAFANALERGEFVECNRYDKASYATLRREIQRYNSRTPVFLIIDTNGKEQVVREYPAATTIFVMPPSVEELERRMRARGANTPEEMERRIAAAKREMAQAPTYQYVVINEKVDACVDAVADIVRQQMSAWEE